MNVSHMKAFIERILEDEKRVNIQKHLTKLSASLQNLVGAPTDTNHQTEVSNRINELHKVLGELSQGYDAAAMKKLADIGALKFFTSELSEEIKAAQGNNQVTPAVIKQKADELTNERDLYLQALNGFMSNTSAFGIESAQLEPGTAEIGFLLPRELFKDELPGLIIELRVLNRVMRAFSEATLGPGKVELAMVRDISTTDPNFFFSLNPKTIAYLAAAITWALGTWHQLEQIRNVRAQTEQLEGFTKEDIKLFDKKIDERIDAAVKQKAGELAALVDGDENRKNEQRMDLDWALRHILARVERGMTVEIRFLPPPVKEVAAGEEAPEQPKEFADLAESQKILSFPKPGDSPVLKLPPLEAPSDEVEKGEGKKKK